MLNNLSIKVKLALILILPLICLFYLSYLNISDKFEKKDSAQKIENINIMNDKVSSFIHELQKERGIISSYLFSNKTVYEKLLNEQIIVTNTSFMKMNRYINSIEHGEVEDFHENLENFFKELPRVRKEVLENKISIDDFILYYSANIAVFLDHIYDTSELSKKTELTRMMLAHGKLLFLKENTAIEQIAVSNILLKNEIDSDSVLTIHDLLSIRNLHSNYFLKLIDDNSIRVLYKELENSYVSIKIRSIEKTIVKQSQIPKMEVESWISLVNKKIEKQDNISKLVSKKIVLKSHIIKDIVISHVKIVVFFNILISLFLVLFVLYIYSGINKNIKKILTGVSFITNNNINQYKNINISSSDELKELSCVFNDMVNKLIQRDKDANVINKKLINAKLVAEKNSKSKSEFLANMSHEIRTPLNSITGFINLLKENEKDTQKLEYLSIVNSSSNNLLEIIHDILDFSKIENNDVLIELRVVDLKDELQLLEKSFKPKIDEKNLHFTMFIDEKLPTSVNIDIGKLKQIMINLIGNAIKFTSTNKSIEINVQYKSKRLFFSIYDEGIGIEKEKQKVIFEPFQQADSSTTRQYGGTGLGLTISSCLVEALGGILTVESTLDVGSKFFFDIPIEISQKVIENESLSSIEKLSGHILLVEDNKSNQAFMKVILKKMYLSYEIVNDGIEAVELYKTKKFDLILMDENMPNLSGTEATKQIRNIENKTNRGHVPIVALTANALIGDKAKFLSVGMDEYLTKPVNKKKLFNILKQFLDKDK